MGDKLILVSDVPVSVNNYLKARSFIMYVKGKAVAQTSVYESKEGKDYKKKFVTYVKNEIIKQGWKYKEGKFVVVKATIYFDKTNRDANNIWKLMIDGLVDSGVVKDDNIIMERVERIYYDVKNPRVELEIYNHSSYGIFDDEYECKMFNDRCQKCTRYNNNCSIWNKCIESRIIEEVSVIDGVKVCSKFKEVVVKAEKVKKDKVKQLK